MRGYEGYNSILVGLLDCKMSSQMSSTHTLSSRRIFKPGTHSHGDGWMNCFARDKTKGDLFWGEYSDAIFGFKVNKTNQCQCLENKFESLRRSFSHYNMNQHA